MQNLNEDLNKIKHSAFQRKISFDPDPSKQAQEVIFSHKPQKLVYRSKEAQEVIFSHQLQQSVYSPLHFNNIAVTQLTNQKRCSTEFSRASKEYIQ